MRIKDIDIFKNSEYETGAISKQFNNLLDDIQKAKKNIIQVSQTLIAASEILTTSSEETSAVTSEVTSSMSNISNAASFPSDELGRRIKTTNILSDNLSESISNAEHMRSAAWEAGNVANKGSDYVKNTVFIEQMSDKIFSLNKKSEVMGSILEVITRIATQTNLLSLIAAIEVAKAGEVGHGFSFVADEVRNLAEQSTASTKYIQILLRDTQAEIKSMVELMSTVTNYLRDYVNQTR